MKFLYALFLAWLLLPISNIFAQYYIIDPQHSHIGFRVRHMGIAWVEGKFTEFGGSFEYYPQDVSKSRVETVIRAGSIDTGSGKRDRHLKSEDFIDSMNTKTIRFVSNKIEPQGPDNFKMTGVLTIKNVAKEVTLDVTRGGSLVDPWGTPRAAFQATTTINRKDFGLTWNRVLESGALLVGEEIEVRLEIEGATPIKSAPKLSDPSLEKARP